MEIILRKELPAVKKSPAIPAQCNEDDRIQLTRDLNREMKLIFDRNHIGIPFPQIVINQPTEHKEATKREANAAAAFVKEQKESTKNITIEH